WVSHTHWDREWYRTFEAFRARLIDTIDCVLHRIQTDKAFRFLLDGQTVVVEDYLQLRPDRREELFHACREGRVAIVPWDVQPDSFLPCGESHIRNLLLGRQTMLRVGSESKVAYTPDSFGHPSQFPQLFAGFGLKAFVHWRGHGSEVDSMPNETRWVAPDGSSVLSCLLRKGYFTAALQPRDLGLAAERLGATALELAETAEQGAVLLLCGIDHAPPDPLDAELAEAAGKGSGFDVQRALLDDFAAALPGPFPEQRGELRGGRLANLLPGVWSSRIPLKLRNRECETELLSFAEPWAALGQFFGLADERPALDLAWRALLCNQAHDSIGGCSVDAVHRQMEGRYDQAFELARETGRRCQERLVGVPLTRETPTRQPFEVAVFNPSPHARTEVVRLALDASPSMPLGEEGIFYHPVLAANNEGTGFVADGLPVRMLPARSDGRFFFGTFNSPMDIEFIARDVPAMGWRRIQLEPATPVEAVVDSATQIKVDEFEVQVEPAGTLSVRMGDQRFTGLFDVEDLGDRGDTYDACLLDDGQRLQWVRVETQRVQQANGIQRLEVRRDYRLPAALEEGRERRCDEDVEISLWVEATLVPGVQRLDFKVRLENRARDHRLRLLFPTHQKTEDFLAASTFDAMERSTKPQDDTGWVHPAARTFPQQGWVSVNGLHLVAPGLPEAEVTSEGTLALTLLRAVGWLARPDLRSRPGPAGPVNATPEAQCLTTVEASLSLLPQWNAQELQAAESGLRAVWAGAEEGALLPEGSPMLELEPASLVLTSFKPAREPGCAIVRVLNPSQESVTASMRFGFEVSAMGTLQLDEEPTGPLLTQESDSWNFEVGAKQLRTFLLRP
ncbi:MAG: hypothetical protein JRC77_04990, partial [Deltaproteobacteria bacterium]|nr:hypothetical protein [Deltaproteobacteria bacterium]